MTSFAFKVDPREAQYARFVGAVIGTLREAVLRRTDEGKSRQEIADRISMNKSVLSRILNGRVRNITAKTISDILWAAEYEPVEFDADAFEDLSPNYVPIQPASFSVEYQQGQSRSASGSYASSSLRSVVRGSTVPAQTSAILVQ